MTARQVQRVGATIAALAGLVLGSVACSSDADGSDAPRPTVPVSASETTAVPANCVQRGGWDGNSNEPLLADLIA